MGQLQETMKATLAASGIPAKEIRVFGSQIMITALSKAAMHKWVDVLVTFSRVRGFGPSLAELKVPRKYGPCKGKAVVYRVWATV